MDYIELKGVRVYEKVWRAHGYTQPQQLYRVSADELRTLASESEVFYRNPGLEMGSLAMGSLLSAIQSAGHQTCAQPSSGFHSRSDQQWRRGVPVGHPTAERAAFSSSFKVLDKKTAAGLTFSNTELITDYTTYFEFLKVKLACALQFVVPDLSTLQTTQKTLSGASTTAEPWYCETLNYDSESIREQLPRAALTAPSYREYMKAFATHKTAVSAQNLKKAELMLAMLVPVGEIRLLEFAVLTFIKKAYGKETLEEQKAFFREELASHRATLFPLSTSHANDVQTMDFFPGSPLDEVDLIVLLMFGAATDYYRLQNPTGEARAVHFAKWMFSPGLLKNCSKWNAHGPLDHTRMLQEFVIQSFYDYENPAFQGLRGSDPANLIPRVRGMFMSFMTEALSGRPAVGGGVWSFDSPQPDPIHDDDLDAVDGYVPTIVARACDDLFCYGIEEDGRVRYFMYSCVDPQVLLAAFRGELSQSEACMDPAYVCNPDESDDHCRSCMTTGCHYKYIHNQQRWALWFYMTVIQLSRFPHLTDTIVPDSDMGGEVRIDNGVDLLTKLVGM